MSRGDARKESDILELGLNLLNDLINSVLFLCAITSSVCNFLGGSEKPGKLEVGGASRDSTGLGALEEGLISS